MSSITVDNASNIINAFKLSCNDTNEPVVDDDDSQSVSSYHDSEEEPIIEEMLFEEGPFSMFNIDEFLSDATDWNDGTDDANVEVTLTEGMQEWMGASLKRNSCLAHLLQLGLNDTLKKDNPIKLLIAESTKIVSFFGRSPKFSDMLKQRTNGMTLIKPCVTRWNSTLYSLERLVLINVKKKVQILILLKISTY